MKYSRPNKDCFVLVLEWSLDHLKLELELGLEALLTLLISYQIGGKGPHSSQATGKV